MSYLPLGPEGQGRPKQRNGVMHKRRRPADEIPDLPFRQVVIKAKLAGTLGRGSRWHHLDPTDEKAWR